MSSVNFTGSAAGVATASLADILEEVVLFLATPWKLVARPEVSPGKFALFCSGVELSGSPYTRDQLHLLWNDCLSRIIG